MKQNKKQVLLMIMLSFLGLVTSACSFATSNESTDSQGNESKSSNSNLVNGSLEASIDLENVDIKQLQELLRSGEVTAVDLGEMYLERIKLLNTNGPGLNAVRSINPNWKEQAEAIDKARASGEELGKMAGIPVLLKDNIDVKGMATTAGSLALENSFPTEDAPVVKELKEAGAIILGKTNLHEFAGWVTFNSPGGYSSLGGMALNPYDVSLSPGSSSSGSAVAATVALSTITIGTDTGGSIMNPAALESLAAMRPTVGLISRTGIVPISDSQDTPGPMGRSVYDVAVALSAMTTGSDPNDEKTKESYS